MKPRYSLLILPILLTSCSLQAQMNEADNAPAPAPKYVAEAPLPTGWPQPGPYNQVSEKSFPAYRAANTPAKGENFAFFRLFQHIKSNDIPMTSPVEMQLDGSKDNPTMTSMRFLYQNTNVGKTGPDGPKVEISDFPAMRTLSYTWQGRNTPANLKTAKHAIDAELAKRKLKTTDFRLMGYNGPGVPANQKTWELIAVLPTN